MNTVAPTNPAPPPRPQVPVLYQWFGGAAAVALAALLGGAGLSGLLAGHGFATPAPLFAILRDWWNHPGDPAAAWSRDPRPGPAWLVYTLVVLIAAALLAAWWRCALVWSARQKRRNSGSNGLASTRDVAGILGERGAKDRAIKLRASMAGQKAKDVDARELVMTLGHNVIDGAPIAIGPRDSLLAFGPSGSGKTWRMAVKPVLYAPGFVLTTTTKGDLLRATCLQRMRKGRVEVFDPEQITAWPSKTRWSLIAGSEDADTATRRTEGMVSARPMGGGNSDAARFYAGRATTVIQCYLHAAALDGRRMSDVRRWSGMTRNGDVLKILERHRPDWAADFAQVTHSGDPKTDANTMATVADILKPLASPKLMAAVDAPAAESLDLNELISGPNTLYLISEGAAQSMAPFVSALATEVHYLAKKRAMRMPDDRLDPPIRMILDEVANVAPIPHLASMLTDSGGRGITIWAFAHGLNQLRDRFGDTQARQIIDSVSARMILPGLMSHELLDDTSKLLGMVETWRPVPGGGDQWRDQPHERRAQSPEAIRTMPEDQALLVYRNQPGVRITIRAWFDGDAEQAALVEPSMAYYNKAVADGKLPPVLAEPVFDPSTASEVPANWVMDLTKGWRR
ncbi:type IV secretory system conjugative DNA transfer family protein [Nocardia sp. CA-120079]|uniref:type IV secretory system conjugative DNA transfer family protein n=1 Tax=Nocardia sp. CA-120079 TaxID=3239974 RepID=UPI003D98B1F1